MNTFLNANLASFLQFQLQNSKIDIVYYTPVLRKETIPPLVFPLGAATGITQISLHLYGNGNLDGHTLSLTLGEIYLLFYYERRISENFKTNNNFQLYILRFKIQ